jgi:hypothetical protein
VGDLRTALGAAIISAAFGRELPSTTRVADVDGAVPLPTFPSTGATSLNGGAKAKDDKNVDKLLGVDCEEFSGAG